MPAAAALGFSESRVRTELRRERWRPLGRGVYLTRPDTPTRADWARVGLALAGRGAVLSGWDGVRYYALGEPRPPRTPVLVLAGARAHNRRVGGVRIRPSIRRLPVVRRTSDESEAIWVAGAARAVADTALDCHELRTVRALVSGAIQRQLCTVTELAIELECGPQNGSALLRQALQDVRLGAASVAEAEAAEVLRSGGLPPFELNAPILDRAGRLIAVADVLWRRLRAILEVDSREFHFAEADWQATMRRHNRLTALGYAVAHYPPSAFRRRPAEVIEEVRTWLLARATHLR